VREVLTGAVTNQVDPFLVLAIGAAVPLGAAILALVGVGLTVLQKNHIDRRDAWWKRVQWALDALDGPEEQRRIGIALLGRLAFEKRVSTEDRALIEGVITSVLGH
jgi:hypothetical protein